MTETQLQYQFANPETLSALEGPARRLAINDKQNQTGSDARPVRELTTRETKVYEVNDNAGRGCGLGYCD